MKEINTNQGHEINDIISFNTKRDLKQPTYRGSNFDEKEFNIDDEHNPEFINQEIPVEIKSQIDSTGTRINLSIDQERIIQKLPSFRIGDRKIHDDVINSDKYLNLKEYKPLMIRNPPIFFLAFRSYFYCIWISINY